MRININDDDIPIPPYVFMKFMAVSLGIFTLLNFSTMVEDVVEYFMRKC